MGGEAWGGAAAHAKCQVERDEASHKNRTQNIFVIVPPKAVGGRIFFLSAETTDDMNKWMAALSRAAVAVERSFTNPEELVIDSFGNKATRPLKEGFLEVQGRGLGGWKQRWVVCRKNVLQLYETKEAAALHRPLGVIPLHDCKVEIIRGRSKLIGNMAYRTVSRKVGLESRREWKWNVQHPVRRDWMLSAADQNIMEDWVLACACAISSSPKHAKLSRAQSEAPPNSFVTGVLDVVQAGDVAVASQGRQFERRYLVQVANVLYMCKDAKAPEASSALELENVMVREERSNPGHFTLTYMHNMNYVCDVRDDATRKEWVAALERGVALGQKENVNARRKLAGDDSIQGAHDGVVHEVEKFSDVAKPGGMEDDFQTAVMDVDVVVGPKAGAVSAVPGAGSAVVARRSVTLPRGTDPTHRETLHRMTPDSNSFDTEEVLLKANEASRTTARSADLNMEDHRHTAGEEGGEDFSVTAIMNILDAERDRSRLGDASEPDPVPKLTDMRHSQRVLRFSKREMAAQSMVEADDVAALTEELQQPATPSAERRAAADQAPGKKAWASKPSPQLAVRSSKAVGRMRKLTPPSNELDSMPPMPRIDEDDDASDSDDLHTLGALPPVPVEDEEEHLSALLRDSIFADQGGGGALTVCPKCSLKRLEEQANFCDGCGFRFPDAVLGDDDRAPADDASLDDSEKEFLAQQGISEEEVKEELVRQSMAVGRITYNKRPPPAVPRGVQPAAAAPSIKRPPSNRQLLPAQPAPSVIPLLPPVESSDSDDDVRVLPAPHSPGGHAGTHSTMDLDSFEVEAAASTAPPSTLPPQPRDPFDSFIDELPTKKKSTAGKLSQTSSTANSAGAKSTAPKSTAADDDEDPLKYFEMLIDNFDEPASDARAAPPKQSKAASEEAARRARAEQEERERVQQRQQAERAERERTMALEAALEARRKEIREREQRVEMLREREERIARAEKEAEEARIREVEATLREREAKLMRAERELEAKRREAEERERLAAEEVERARREAEKARLDAMRREREAKEVAERARREAEAARKEAELREREAALAREEAARVARETELRERERELREREQREREQREREMRARRVEADEAKRRAAEEAKRAAEEAAKREAEEARRREEEARRREEEEQRLKEERLKRQEAERLRREEEDRREREEAARQQAQWAELQAKIDVRKLAAADAPPAPKAKARMTPADQTAYDKLVALLKNDYIDQKEFDARVAQIMVRYKDTPPASSSAAVVTPSPAPVVVASAGPAPAPTAAPASGPAAATPAATASGAARSVTATSKGPKQADCPHCGRSINASKKFCPHCGKNTAITANGAPVVAAAPAAAPPTKVSLPGSGSGAAATAPGAAPPIPKKAAARPVATPEGLSDEDAVAVAKLKQLLDMQVIDVPEYNSRVQLLLARAQQQAKKSVASQQMDDLARALNSDATRAPQRRTTGDEDTDEELMSELGLPPPTRQPVMVVPKERTVHDEGLSELEEMMRDL